MGTPTTTVMVKETERFVPVDETRLWVLEMGEGYPLLALHGGPGMDHTQFRPWLDPLAERFRLIYVDQRSQGRSDLASEDSWTIEQMAADVTKLSRGLGLERFALLGHSFGSFVALQHAVDHGSASHYILSGCVPGARWLDQIDRNVAALQPEDVRRRIENAWDREQSCRTVPEFREILRDQLPFHFKSMGPGYERFLGSIDDMRLSPDVLRVFAQRDYGHIDVEDRLGEIRRPVLVIVGDTDRVTDPQAGYAIAEGVPDAEYVLIPNAGHMTFAEQPEAFRRTVLEFLDRHPAG